MDVDIAKQAAAKEAALLVHDGMIVGLGTGSTAEYFIRALAKRVQEQRLRIQTVASSLRSAELAKELGLSVLDIDQAPRIDLTIDGADEVDPQRQMIKGAGGAHTREKILATASLRMVAIVDENKCVSQLGEKGKLPVEILPYGAMQTSEKIKALGLNGAWRQAKDGTRWRSDNGNYIFDVALKTPPKDPKKLHEELCQIPGVIETGFFLNVASEIIVGKSDGSFEIF